ncbi:uncharacterized protein ARMOST_11403 [Armillaria ostoyae]|uniref:Uncharacterized protein n=1 Tax=Armillaria ostoyae TaxID=47428 RepID=A0A284RH09_ARMOS|nr:uncharacterized protein ARMOST_11403 [Armillaria ostoyae]
MPAPELNQSNEPWSTTSLPWPWQRGTDPTWMEPPHFDEFYYDSETFRKLDEYAPYPSVLPDSPPPIQLPLYTFRRIYPSRQGTSDNPPTEPPQPTSAERLQQALELAERKAQRIEELKQEVEEAE